MGDRVAANERLEVVGKRFSMALGCGRVKRSEDVGQRLWEPRGCDDALSETLDRHMDDFDGLANRLADARSDLLDGEANGS